MQVHSLLCCTVKHNIIPFNQESFLCILQLQDALNEVRGLWLVLNSPTASRAESSLTIEHRLPELQSLTSVSTPPFCLFKVRQLQGFGAVCFPSRFEV